MCDSCLVNASASFFLVVPNRLLQTINAVSARGYIFKLETLGLTSICLILRYLATIHIVWLPQITVNSLIYHKIARTVAKQTTLSFDRSLLL